MRPVEPPPESPFFLMHSFANKPQWKVRAGDVLCSQFSALVGQESCRTLPIRARWEPQSVPQQEESFEAQDCGTRCWQLRATNSNWKLLMEGGLPCLRRDRTWACFSRQLQENYVCIPVDPPVKHPQGWKEGFSLTVVAMAPHRETRLTFYKATQCPFLVF